MEWLNYLNLKKQAKLCSFTYLSESSLHPRFVVRGTNDPSIFLRHCTAGARSDITAFEFDSCYNVFMEITNKKRIAIVGISGSGKSTFSRKLAEKTKLPLFHMDLLFWKDNWEAVPEEVYLQRHTELILKDEWIIEGYIDKSMKNRVERADLIIYLDYSGPRCFWRGLKRILKYRGKARPELPEGCFDHFSHRFLWIILTRAERKNIENALMGIDENKIRRFSSPRELSSYFESN